MSISRADRTPRARRSRARGLPALTTSLRQGLCLGLCLGLLVPLLAACSGDEPPGPTEATLEQTEDAIGQVLRRRSRALLDDDERAFARTVARRLRPAQRGYYANLQQLPLESLRSTVVHGTAVETEDGRSFWVEVETSLLLDGYDAAPVSTRDRWRFTLDEHGRRFALSSVEDPEWEASYGTGQQPWDAGPIRVEERFDVLGIFDPSTVRLADQVLDSASEAHYDVASALPEPREDADDLGTVVYVLSDDDVVAGLSGRPVADPQRADGLTVAIPTDAAASRGGSGGASGGGVASYRMVLNPAVVGTDQMALDRLVRHELTHVLLGDRGRGGPLWLTEGVAEYVSVQRLAPSERRLPTTALAVGATATGLPGEAEFAGADAQAWYAVSWWVCEYIARTFGDELLWILLDEMAEAEDPAAVLAERLSLTEDALVQRGVALMTSTYG